MDCSVEFLFKCIGIVTSLYIGLKIASKIIHACRVYFFPTYPDFFKYGKWSVVTGSTDGIGKAIALHLASKGQNIILIARNRTKLNVVANEIESTYKVETKFLQIDFSHDEGIYDKIEEFLKGVDIGTLVNNVGIAMPPFKYLDTPNLSSVVRDMTRINMYSLYKMHQIVLPGMVQRRRGLIINMSSVGSLVPLICFAIYGSTKAFVSYFSQAISYEYADKGITIQTCLPGLVSTNLTGNPATSFFGVSAKSFAASLLATVEKERFTHGCWRHSLRALMYKLIPISWVHAALLRTARGLVKQAAEKSE